MMLSYTTEQCLADGHVYGDDWRLKHASNQDKYQFNTSSCAMIRDTTFIRLRRCILHMEFKLKISGSTHSLLNTLVL